MEQGSAVLHCGLFVAFLVLMTTTTVAHSASTLPKAMGRFVLYTLHSYKLYI